MAGRTLDYRAVQELSYRVGRALDRSGIRPGDKVAILALAPLTHAAGVLCFPVLTLGGEIVVMPAPDLADF